MLTVLIATRNGARTLPRVLEAYTRLQAPSGGWKLVVVDNASTDQTKKILLSFQNKLPLRCLFEERPGKNICLNTAMVELEGDLAIFTDDDAIPRPDWLVAMRTAANSHPDYSLFGGVVLPNWEIAPPSWIRWVPAGPTFAISDPAWKEGPVDAGCLFGPNMAIRADVFRSGIRFDPSIGPQGTNYRMGSETELLMRLSQQGHKAWYVQAAVVEHCIRDFQMEQSWVWKRALRFGRGQYYLRRDAIPCWFGLPFRLLPRVIQRGLRIAKARTGFREHELVLARWEFNYLMGHVLEARNWYHEQHARK
jgi:L-malate glycosyltransferase